MLLREEMPEKTEGEEGSMESLRNPLGMLLELRNARKSGTPAHSAKMSEKSHSLNPLWIQCLFSTTFSPWSRFSGASQNSATNCIDICQIDPDDADELEAHAPAGTRTTACCYVNPFSKKIRRLPPRPPQPCHGGILGDAMGLGKTIEMISLIMADKALQATRHNDTSTQQHALQVATSARATLVLCPTSVLSQWELEMKTHTPLRVVRYYGQGRSLNASIAAHVDVVLTTYGVVTEEAKQFNSAADPLFASSRQNGEPVASAGVFSVHWRRIALDEAHYINNRDTQSAHAVALLHGDKRWCITGSIVNARCLR